MGDFAWAPDGTRIDFLRFTWNKTNGPVREGIAIANADGSSVCWVTSGPNFAHSPSWGVSR